MDPRVLPPVNPLPGKEVPSCCCCCCCAVVPYRSERSTKRGVYHINEGYKCVMIRYHEESRYVTSNKHQEQDIV